MLIVQERGYSPPKFATGSSYAAAAAKLLQSCLTLSDRIDGSQPGSVVPVSSCPQSLPTSESFPMSQLFARGGIIPSKEIPGSYTLTLLSVSSLPLSYQGCYSSGGKSTLIELVIFE